MKYAVSASACVLVLLGCGGSVPPPPPVDAGPRPDAGMDAGIDSGVDAGVDTGVDVGIDAFHGDANDTDSGCGGRMDCDGVVANSCETTLGTITNCLMCNERCLAPANATPVCDWTTGCGWACNRAFADCNAIPGDGCEVNIDTDRMHCGDCTTMCPLYGLNTVASCSGGDCLLRCQGGFGDCDGDLMDPTGNGCEIDTNSSVASCGTCGNACLLPVGAVFAIARCGGGACRIMCMTGHLDCNANQLDGCEFAGMTCP